MMNTVGAGHLSESNFINLTTKCLGFIALTNVQENHLSLSWFDPNLKKIFILLVLVTRIELVSLLTLSSFLSIVFFKSRQNIVKHGILM